MIQPNKGKSKKWLWLFQFRKFILEAAVMINRPGRQKKKLFTTMDPTFVVFNDEAWVYFSAYLTS
jgi:hypothetical protein